MFESTTNHDVELVIQKILRKSQHNLVDIFEANKAIRGFLTTLGYEHLAKMWLEVDNWGRE